PVLGRGHARALGGFIHNSNASPPRRRAMAFRFRPIAFAGVLAMSSGVLLAGTTQAQQMSGMNAGRPSPTSPMLPHTNAAQAAAAFLFQLRCALLRAGKLWRSLCSQPYGHTRVLFLAHVFVPKCGT